MTTNEAINSAAAGQDSTVEIYWDSQDPSDAGVAYRFTDGSDSGPCEFVRWSADDADGYNIGDYFDADGRYQGPDADGVYPVFVA